MVYVKYAFLQKCVGDAKMFNLKILPILRNAVPTGIKQTLKSSQQISANVLPWANRVELNRLTRAVAIVKEWSWTILITVHATFVTSGRNRTTRPSPLCLEIVIIQAATCGQN